MPSYSATARSRARSRSSWIAAMASRASSRWTPSSASAPKSFRCSASPTVRSRIITLTRRRWRTCATCRRASAAMAASWGSPSTATAAARLLRYVADQGGPLSRLLADLPVTVATPELRVDCADDRKFEIVQRAAKHFASKYPVSTLDGVRITFAQGWGLLRASNTQPVLVLRFEAASESALASYRTEVESWLAAQSPGA